MNILAGICRGSAKIVLSSALFLGAAFSGHADTYYVDASALANGADGTEQRPFPTIQAAVDAASANDTIRVAAGRYSASSGRVGDDTKCESVVIRRLGEDCRQPCRHRGSGDIQQRKAESNKSQ